MAGEFDITALINVQLAQGAGKKLSDDILAAINKGNYDVNINVKDNYVPSAELKRVLGRKSVTLKIEISNEDELNKKLAVFQGDLKKNILITIDPKTTKSINEITLALSDLSNAVGGLAKLENIGKALNSVKKGTDIHSIKERTSKYTEAGKALKEFRTRLAALARKEGATDFFSSSNDELSKFIKSFGELNSAETFNKAAKKFEGLFPKQILRNVIADLENVYATVTKIGNLKQSAISKGIIAFDPTIEKSLDAAQKRAKDLFGTINSGDPVALRSDLDAINSEMRLLVADAREYKAIIKGMEREKYNARSTGADKSVTDSIQEQINLTKQLRQEGLSAAKIKDDPRFILGSSGVINAKNVSKEADNVLNKIYKLAAAADSSDLFKSEASQILGLGKAYDGLIAKAREFTESERSRSGVSSTDRIKKEFIDLDTNLKALVNDAVNLQKVLEAIDKKKYYYASNGMTAAEARADSFRQELIRLAATEGKVTSVTGSFFLGMNNALEAFDQNARKVDKFISSIDRLKASLGFNLGGYNDLAGVGKSITKLEQDIKTLGDVDPTNFDDRAIRKKLSEGSYEIRAKDRLNKVADAAISRYDKLIDHKIDIGETEPAKILDKAKLSTENYINSLKLADVPLEDIKKKIVEIGKVSDKTFNRAIVDSEGGYFGALGKSIGFAIKRLGAFLFAARAIYGVQNAFISATDSAAELDVEFTRLEQILSGSEDKLESVGAQVNRLSAEILNLGKTYGVATTEIAQSADILAQAGIPEKDLEKILEITTKAQLGPTFKNNVEITEAVIAALNQFELQAADVEDIIGGISHVSAQYAVESEGITKAIRRAGGAFSAARGDAQSYMSALGEFIGAFTVLKSQTREADETLATSLRNVLNRLQRANVQQYLKENFNIDLLNENGQFIGFVSSIEAVSGAIKKLGLQSSDPKFAALIQKLAGSLQSSRLTSLITEADEIRKAAAKFNIGGEILDKDADIAFGSLTNKITRATNAIVELFTAVARNNTFKAMVELLVIFTQALTTTIIKVGQLVDQFGFLGQAIAAVALVKPIGLPVYNAVKNTLLGAKRAGLAGPGRAATGGLIPGNGPNIDTEPYLLAKGEYVVNKYSVARYGKDFFHKLNAGKIKMAARGSGPGGMIGYRSIIDVIRDQGPANLGFTKGVSDLIKELHKVGVHISGLSKYVRNFKVLDEVRAGANNEIAGGSYSPQDKVINITKDVLKYSPGQALNHEIGHAVDFGTDQTINMGNVPESLHKYTEDRMSANAALYKDLPNGKNVELFADLFEKAVRNRVVDQKKRDELYSKEEQDYLEGFLQSVEMNSGIKVDSLKSFRKKKKNNRTRKERKKEESDAINYLSQTVSPASQGDTHDIIQKILSSKQSNISNRVEKSTKAKDVIQNINTIKNSLGDNLARERAIDSFGPGSEFNSSRSRSRSGSVQSKINEQTKRSSGPPQIQMMSNSGGFFTTPLFNGPSFFRKKQEQFGPSVPEGFVRQTGSGMAMADAYFASRGGNNNGGNPPSGGGGNQPPDDPDGPKGFKEAFATASKALFSWQSALGIATFALGAWSSTSQESKEMVEELTPAIGAAIAALGAYSLVVNNLEAFQSKESLEKGTGKTLGALGAGLLAATMAAKAFADVKIEKLNKQISETTDRREAGDLLAQKRTYERVSDVGGILGYGASGALLGASVGAKVGTLFGGNTAIGTGVGAVVGGAAGLYAGYKTTKQQKEEDKRIEGVLAGSGADLNFFSRGARKNNGINRSEVDKLVSSVKDLTPLTVGLSSQSIENQKAVHAQADQLRASLEGLNPFKRMEVINEAKKSGADIEQVFKNLNEPFDAMAITAHVAANELSKVFLVMTAQSKSLTNLITSFDANIATINNEIAKIGGAGSQNFIAKESFESIRNGVKPGGLAGQQLDARFQEFRRFNARGAANAQLEFSGARAARDASNALATGGIRINGNESLTDSVVSMFGKITEGLPEDVGDSLNDMFLKYIKKQRSELDNSTGSGEFDIEKVNEVLTGFADSIQRGGIDTFEKFSESTGAFRDALSSAIAEINKYELKINQLRASNINVDQRALEFKQKARGDYEPELKYAQVKAFEARKKDELFRGTGLTGASSAQDLARVYSSLATNNPFREVIMQSLEEMANGTESFTAAMRDYDVASEKAKKRTEALSNALLGTDEDLSNYARGILAAGQISSASSGQEAFMRLNSMSDRSKAGLRAYYAANPDEQQNLNRKLGIAPAVFAKPEADQVNTEFEKQKEANDALIKINTGLSADTREMTNALLMNRESFERLGANVNIFATAANNLATNMTNIPQNITHTHTMTVAPIQVNVVGMNGDNGPMQQMVTQIVNERINEFGSNLRQKNKGLTVDTLTGRTA